MARSEVKYGSLLSYLLIILNSLYGLVITPYILGTIGNSEYGVYQTIAAMTNSLAVLELGIGSTLQRYIAKYNALRQKARCFNFSAMGLIQAIVLSLVMAIVGIALFFSLDSLYASSFTPLELSRAKQIYIILVIYVVFHIYENVLWGIISGYNRFVFSNSLKIVLLVLKVVLYLVLLPIIKNALVIVSISLFIEIVSIVVELFYLSVKLHHRIVLFKWDSQVFKESFLYTILLFIQSLVIQFNGNVDNMVIGSKIGAAAVTIYSFALVIFNMFESFSTSVSSVLLPTVTNVIYDGATPRQMEDLVIKYGRVQWIFLGAALFGFICCGQEFFKLWLGDGFEDCYSLSLILMIPVVFPLIVNTCLAILKVRNLLTFRTIALTYAAVANAIITIWGVGHYGYWAAALGTALSTIISGVLSLNLYYQHKLQIRMLYVYRSIFGKTVLCLLAACIPCTVLNLFITGSWMSFALKALLFMVVYWSTLQLFGFNAEEKELFDLKKIMKLR